MFGFEYPEDGSEQRYDQDVKNHVEIPAWVEFRGWWLIHNCITHPLIGLFPTKFFFDLHDWTSHKMHGK